MFNEFEESFLNNSELIMHMVGKLIDNINFFVAVNENEELVLLNNDKTIPLFTNPNDLKGFEKNIT